MQSTPNEPAPRGFFPSPPDGYSIGYHEPRHLLLAFHADLPVLYLDERTNQWQELQQHVTRLPVWQ